MTAGNQPKDVNGRGKETNSTAKNITSSTGSSTKNGYVSGDNTRSSSSHQFNRKFTDERP